MNLSLLKRSFIGLIILFVSSLFTDSYGQVGASYCGSYIESEPLRFNGISDTTISELEISNSAGHCIELSNCSNVVIEKCKLGSSSGNGINLYNCDNIVIRNCKMSEVATGVYAQLSEGISVTNIEVVNVQGPYPRGQMVQFNNVSGSGNKINYNVVQNTLGESEAEDAINVYQSNGTLNDPIQIVGNWIRGGGPSSSGGGILLGDVGGSHYLVKDNILVDPGQYGIGVASGTNITVSNNKIYGKEQSFTNVGLYVWNQYETDCDTITVTGNEVNWTNKEGDLNGAWNSGNCGLVEGWTGNSWSADIDENILSEQITNECIHLGVVEVENSLITISPNPMNGLAQFSESVSGTVYNAMGVAVSEIKDSKNLDLRGFTEGIYIVKTTGGKEFKVIYAY